MTQSVQTGRPAGAAYRIAATRPPPRSLAQTLFPLFALSFALPAALSAQEAKSTGPQQLTFAGLRAVPTQVGIPEGQINAVATDTLGNLYLLIDQNDGIRVLKTDPAAATILAQAQLGARGDSGLAMALDPSGNVYVTGTTTSGALTATSGAAFLTASSAESTNSFIAKFDPNLNTTFVTFAGGGSLSASALAATSDAVFITGSIFAATLPVTSGGIIQAPASGSTGNGFVEKFSATGTTLLYATYLSGANGSTTPTAIAADISDNAYIAGNTTSPGYPTIAAVVSALLTSKTYGSTSGFLTKLTPTGNGITFSTYIPGGGITSLALDPVANNLLLSGAVAPGQFPIATVQTPLTAVAYQALLRLSLDGSTVVASTLLAPGAQSFVAAGASSTAWVDISPNGMLTLPLLPLTPLSTIGNSFAVRVNAANLIDQTARFGGIAASNPGNAAAPVNLTSVAIDPSGDALIAGSFAPTASASLLATQTFDLPLANAPTTAFPSTVHAAVLPASACAGSLCPGAAAWLAKLAVPATAAAASLALSLDDFPNLTLRNLGSAQATGLQIATTGFTNATNCTTTLAAGGECSIALTGIGPGSITVSATNATPQTQALPALPAGTTPLAVVFSPKELDFGIVSSASPPTTRTITVTNLNQQTWYFTSALNINAKITLPYTITTQTSDCTLAGIATYALTAGASCHITLSLAASSISANDGPIQQTWQIGTRYVQLTAYGQAAALSLSAAEIDFGTQYTGGLRLPRFLYLSNNSTTAIPHTAVTLPTASPFTLADNCPATLDPLTVCQLKLSYQSPVTPSTDSVTVNLDQGLTALVTGRTLPLLAVNAASVNPNLSVSATALNFATAVVVTGVSSSTQTLSIQNTGASAFSLALTLTGDFTDTTNCAATLAGNASCSVVVSFAPSQPGARQGLLAVTAGAGTTPAYVTLTGMGTAILTPAGNGTLSFGSVFVGQPSVQWYKITQPFTSFAVSTSSNVANNPFTAILVEDIGYGHGAPASSAFATAASGTCFNCWLGVEFTPTAAGLQTGSLSFLSTTSAASPYVLTLSGTGLPLTGLILTPGVQDFGPVPINSVSGPSLFVLTNLTAAQTSVTLTAPTTTGDFTVATTPTGGAACTGALAYTASCYIEVTFAPTAAGQRTGTLTVQAGSNSTTAALTGYASADPGLAFNPTALTFNNIPDPTSTQQTITLTNTSTSPEQIATPTLTGTSFAATTTCATLAPAATCTIAITFTPATAPAAATLTIPVTNTVGGAPLLTDYTVPLTGAYTTENAGIEILANDTQFGPQTTAAIGITRQFTLDNLTAKALTLTVDLPRQFVLSGPPCSGLAPFASCNFSVAFLPLDNGDITGTLFAQATPTDGSATLNGLAYVEGYGLGAAALTITGAFLPAGVLPFGQIPSGQSLQKVLTLTNTSATLPLTVRRVTSQWPFLATTTCGANLTPSQSCTVTVTYTPLNQVAAGTSSPPSLTDIGSLIVESDAASSPNLIDLTGTSTAVALAAPSNTAPLAAFTASQSSLTFAATMAGDISAPQTLTLNNTGTATLQIANLLATPDFTVSSNCATILPATSCTLSVTFTPQASSTGPRVSAIEISSNAATALEFISLLGTSTPSTLVLSATSLSFGTVLVGANTSVPLLISNIGAAPVTFYSIAASGDYSATSGSCPLAGGALAPATSCTAQIIFAPTIIGTRTGTASVTTSASTLPLTVALTGTGAQSHLQITPASLSFGAIALAAPASLTLTLANTGTVAITGIALTATGDYAVTTPCALATLTAGTSCSVTITFTPTTLGARPGTLTITSSDSSSPDAVPLTGTGAANGSFTLTTSGAATASVTVTSGNPASYPLTITPVNNFTGAVVLNCTPITPAEYASCSLLPSTVTLTAGAQNSTATLTTVTSVSANTIPTVPSRNPRRSIGDITLALFLPTLLLWRTRASRRRTLRSIIPIACTLLLSVALSSVAACGGNGTAANTSNNNLRYAPSGTYQYQVTASSISGATQLTQSVSLTLTIQ